MVRLALRLWALGYLVRVAFTVLAVAAGLYLGVSRP